MPDEPECVNRATALARLRDEALADEACRDGRPRIVFGEGSPDAKLMLVGEAPGDVEERLGRPFVGPAGKLLDRALAEAGVDRSDVWITNLVKMRPVAGEGRRLRNRPPTLAEVAACRRWVEREIEVIRPRAIVCLGATAASGLIHPRFKLGEERGHWFPGPEGAECIATYHPSYPLRLVGESFDRVFGAMVEDLASALRRAQEGPR